MITNELISEIKSKINDNHKQAITGGILQGVLVDMVKSLCEVYPQTYTDEEKAQARANIDALSNHNGEITKEKLSLEVQAILNDVANKQNISDATLATIAKTIVGAINEVYKGGLEDASIATSKIKDGAVTDAKIANGAVTTPKIANDAVTTEKVYDGAITEPKLDTDLVNIITSAVQPAELASAIATALTSYVAKADIVDTTGSATDKVMSQHGATEAIDVVTNKVTELDAEIGEFVLDCKSGSTSESLVRNFSAGEKIYISYIGASYIKFIQYHDMQNVEHTSARVDIQEGILYEYVFPEDAKDINFYFGNQDPTNKGKVQVMTTALKIASNWDSDNSEKIDNIRASAVELILDSDYTSQVLHRNFKKGDFIFISYNGGNSYIRFIQYHDINGVEHTSARVDIYEGTLYKYIFPEDAISINGYFGNTDQANKMIVAYTTSQADIYELKKRVSRLEDSDVSLKVFEPQLDGLESNCYLGSRTYGAPIGKCLQLAHVSDTHGDYNVLKNAVALSDYPTIDAVIHTGDYLVSTYATSLGKDEYADIVSKSNKPILFALGNHDVGDGNGVSFCGTHSQVHATFIAPLENKGFINSNGKNYYFKDFPSVNTRVIVLYEQDMPLDYDDSVWQHISYNASYPIGVNGQSYSMGDCINIEGHTDASFRAVVNTTLDTSYGYNKTTEPAYKINRGWRVFSKEQMQWFCNALSTTPNGYSVVVALHNFFSENISLVNGKFTSKNANTGVSHNCMQTDILAEIVHAFNNRQPININVATKPSSAPGTGNGNASYLNTLNDGQGNYYWYNLFADFSNVDNSIKFVAFIGGHVHFDVVVRHSLYPELLHIGETAVSGINQKIMGFADIKTSDVKENLSYNCINVEGFDATDMCVRLTKIGARYTIDGELRDFDKVSVL